MTQIFVNPIGSIRTPFKQKFAIPRQPNLVDAPGCIEMHPEYASESCFKGLQNYSHLWLVFHFSATADAGWKPTVKAPRLGGDAKLGVFASRSTFRPNSLGLSVVKNLGFEFKNGIASLNVSGVDLLDRTPILDIKPYLAYSDAITDSTATLFNETPIEQPQTVSVRMSITAQHDLDNILQQYPNFVALVTGVLAQDPRPAYKRKLDVDDKLYAVTLYDIDVWWQFVEGEIVIQQFTPLASL